MNNITTAFEDVMTPCKALLVYQSLKKNGSVYVEAYDMDEKGCPINAHPLSVDEASALAESLDSSPELQRSFLKPKGLLADNILYINPDKNGFVIWYSKPKEIHLFFKRELGIPDGKANLPSFVWKAYKNELYLYALKNDKKPTLKTPLFYAPFFNIHEQGAVCMGTVAIDIDDYTRLEDFIEQWEQYFFNSYFSHLLDNYNPVNENIIQLWKRLISTKEKFPVDTLKPNKQTLQNLLR